MKLLLTKRLKEEKMDGKVKCKGKQKLKRSNKLKSRKPKVGKATLNL
jgi:hypothetical protein